MEKNTRKSGPDLLALAMRRARDDVAAGRVPMRPPQANAESVTDPTDSPKQPVE